MRSLCHGLCHFLLCCLLCCLLQSRTTAESFFEIICIHGHRTERASRVRVMKALDFELLMNY